MSYLFTRDRTAKYRESFDEVDLSTINRDNQQTALEEHRKSHTKFNFMKMKHNVHPVEESTAENGQDLNTLDGFFQRIEAIKNELLNVNENIDHIERLHMNAINSSSEQQWFNISKELESVKYDTRELNAAIKQGLTDVEMANSKQRHGPDDRIRSTQFQALRKKFMDTIKRYQDIERAFQSRYRQRIERQIRIVKPGITNEEMDEIMDNLEEGDSRVFQQSIIQATRRGQSKTVLNEVLNRQQEIERIENTIIELHQLFMDISLLVETQGDTLNDIEKTGDATANQLEEGTQLLSRAVRLAKSTRTKKFCCLFLCVGICVMIAILVWWFGFGHPGVGDN